MMRLRHSMTCAMALSMANDATVKRIIRLTQELVQIPSQGGIDPPRVVCQALFEPLFSGQIDTNTGRLYGRGSADSKIAAAMFVEVGRALIQQKEKLKGSIVLFFDAAEHTGTFHGVKALLQQRMPNNRKLDGVIIGYPGNESLNIGSRDLNAS